MYLGKHILDLLEDRLFIFKFSRPVRCHWVDTWVVCTHIMRRTVARHVGSTMFVDLIHSDKFKLNAFALSSKHLVPKPQFFGVPHGIGRVSLAVPIPKLRSLLFRIVGMILLVFSLFLRCRAVEMRFFFVPIYHSVICILHLAKFFHLLGVIAVYVWVAFHTLAQIGVVDFFF